MDGGGKMPSKSRNKQIKLGTNGGNEEEEEVELLHSPLQNRHSSRNASGITYVDISQNDNEAVLLNIVDDNYNNEMVSTAEVTDNNCSSVDATFVDTNRRDNNNLVIDLSNDNSSNEWRCPRCTLLNPVTEPNCDACYTPNSDAFLCSNQNRNQFNRSSSHQLRTHRHQHHQSQSSPSSSLGLISGGTMIGATVGAAGSYISGRYMLSGAFEGGTTGAVGGAFLHEVLQANESSSRSIRSNNGSTQQDTNIDERGHQSSRNGASSFDISSARSSAAMGVSGYPTMHVTNLESVPTSTHHRNNPRFDRQLPRSSFRSERTVDADGNEVTVTTGGGITTTHVTRTIARNGSGRQNGGRSSALSASSNHRRRNSRRSRDQIMDLMVHQRLQSMASSSSARRSAMSGHNGTYQHLIHQFLLQNAGGFQSQSGGPDVDNMNYEQLLRTFGDGTENLGASEGRIRQLPTHAVTENSSLPEDAKQCLICLEDFSVGDSRTILPCLHGFHDKCCKKWLKTNGSCPICKHRI